jgi:hypothetical protein
MREQLASDGWVHLRDVGSFEEAARDPRFFVTRILGEDPWLLERQPIRPIEGGRSFASSMMTTPFHTDSQLALGMPPLFQCMLCVRPAESDGESVFLDTWPLLDSIARADPDLFRDLFTIPRRAPFIFGDVIGPTVSRRGGHLVFTHSALAADAIAGRLAPFIAAAPVIELRPRAGDFIVANNHRLLHGRRSFEDPRREFLRLLVYSRRPLAAPESWLAAALDVAPPAPTEILDEHQARVANEMLRGVPPGFLAHRERIPEALLYRWRDAVLLQSPQEVHP